MSPDRADLLQRIVKAIPEFLTPINEGGLTQAQVCEKYRISLPTLRRHLRKRGLELSAMERAIRRSRGGQVKNVVERSKCVPGCTCPKHKNRPVMGRRLCTYPNHAGPRWLPLSYFHARERLEDGTPTVWQSWCTTCMRIDQRIRLGVKKRGRPYEARKPAMTPDQVRARRRERYHALMANPDWHERRKEYERIWQEGWRRRQGIQPRTAMIEKRKIGGLKADPSLEIMPFQEWIEERASFYAAEYEVIAADGQVAGLTHLAQACEIPPRTLRRFLDGREVDKNGNERQITHVPLGTVDKCLTNEGTTFLWEIYDNLPDELEKAA